MINNNLSVTIVHDYDCNCILIEFVCINILVQLCKLLLSNDELSSTYCGHSDAFGWHWH